jgi:hypothetical protein
MFKGNLRASLGGSAFSNDIVANYTFVKNSGGGWDWVIIASATSGVAGGHGAGENCVQATGTSKVAAAPQMYMTSFLGTVDISITIADNLVSVAIVLGNSRPLTYAYSIEVY